MVTKNTAYTCFSITGNFDPENAARLLDIKPSGGFKIGDARRDGAKYDFARLEVGRCEEYDVYTSNQMRRTLAPLLDKTELLNKIREENDVKLYLEVVVHIYPGESTPALAPELDIIDFCHATRTEIDIDTYVYSPKE